MVTSFLKGFFAPLRALPFILKNPRVLALVVVPLSINLALYGLFFYYGSNYLEQKVYEWHLHLAQMLPNWMLWSKSILFWSMKILSWLSLTVAAALSFTIVGSILAAPFNDLLSKQTIYARHKKGTYKSTNEIHLKFKRMIKLETLRTVILIAGGSFAFLLGLIPFMQIPALMLASTLVAFEYFGIPMCRHYSTLNPVWFFTFRNLFLSLGFGMCLLLLMAIPFASIFYIPLAVVAGTILYDEKSSK